MLAILLFIDHVLGNDVELFLLLKSFVYDIHLTGTERELVIESQGNS